jgi:hypothetical protein
VLSSDDRARIFEVKNYYTIYLDMRFDTLYPEGNCILQQAELLCFLTEEEDFESNSSFENIMFLSFDSSPFTSNFNQ